MIVSVTLPVHNAEEYLDECFESILNQELSVLNGEEQSHLTLLNSSLNFEIEVSIYEDASSDSSLKIIEKWLKIFESQPGFSTCFTKNETLQPKGVGYGRNQTITQSSGEFICFCDADDVMASNRISKQLSLAMQNPNALVGSKFDRIPENSTKILTQWANSINPDQLKTQIYLSFGPSLIMPTWFCRRDTFEKVEGGFNERGKGVPEDLIFFYRFLDLNGDLVRADEELVAYRYHPNATTFSITDEVIWNTRLERLETNVLSQWNKFSIWNAGKLGRRLYRALSATSQNKLKSFCDVDKKKITQKWYHPYPLKQKVPIVHVNDASPPFVICVKTELTLDENGDFQKLLQSLALKEGLDYFYFN